MPHNCNHHLSFWLFLFANYTTKTVQQWCPQLTIYRIRIRIHMEHWIFMIRFFFLILSFVWDPLDSFCCRNEEKKKRKTVAYCVKCSSLYTTLQHTIAEMKKKSFEIIHYHYKWKWWCLSTRPVTPKYYSLFANKKNG